jgi:sugar fermentation stimulation protein A
MSAGDRPVRALLSAEVFRHLRQRLRLRVGALGRFWFRPGVYLYVGSAQRNLRARTERHGRKNKPLRWHIDYLSAKATMLGAVLVPGSRQRECGLAQQVAALFGRVIPGFGASDCGCEGHLFYSPRFDLPKRTGTS